MKEPFFWFFFSPLLLEPSKTKRGGRGMLILMSLHSIEFRHARYKKFFGRFPLNYNFLTHLSPLFKLAKSGFLEQLRDAKTTYHMDICILVGGFKSVKLKTKVLNIFNPKRNLKVGKKKNCAVLYLVWVYLVFIIESMHQRL